MVVVVTPGKEIGESSLNQWFWSVKVVFVLFSNIFNSRDFPRKAKVNMARDNNYHDALHD